MGLLSKLFTRAAKPQPTKPEVIRALISTYGAAIEKHAESGAIVSDVSKLPAPKDVIRAALISAIAWNTDNVAREQLKSAYVMLAEFQPDVGPSIIRWDLELSAGETVQAQASRIAAQGPLVMQWQQRITEEMAALLKDLTDANL